MNPTGLKSMLPPSNDISGEKQSLVHRKFIPVQPMNLNIPELMLPCPAKKSGEKQSSVRRKFIPVQPMNLNIPELMLPSSSSGKKSGEKQSSVQRKFIPVEPMNLNIPELMQPSSFTKNSEKPSSVRSKFIPFQSLHLTPADFVSPKAKKRKIERPICKELFKIPQTLGRRSSINNRRSITRSSTRSYLTSKKMISTKKQMDSSPLLDVDEAEELLIKKNKLIKGPFKNVLFPMESIKEELVKTKSKESLTSIQEVFENENSLLKTCNEEITPPPSNDDSELEFLLIEEKLASAKKVSTSPMTSVCELLENTKITNTGGVEKDLMNEIMTIVKEDYEQFAEMKQQIDAYMQKHQKNLDSIVKLLESIENKENSNRRSIRVAKQTIKTKFVISPAISNKVDLRKSTLNKNLSKNIQDESPRTKKAVDMYNNMRNDCNILCTPKMDRSNINLPQTSVTRSLSRRIQKQCLLLQDTPKL